MFVNELFGDEHVEKIESTLKSAGYTELGSGADASVWGKDEGSVIKILMPESGELATAEKIFLAYYKTAQKYRDNPHLVKFIDIGGKHFTKFNIDGETFYQIAVEKLKPLKSRSFEEAMVWAMSDLVSNNFSWADAYRQISNPNSTIWKFADNDEINKTKVIKTIASLNQSKLLQLQYLYLTMQLVYQIGRRQGFGWDLHTENAMQRSDGTIVITDPWYSDVLSESFVLGVAESQTAKTGIMQTDVYGSRAYHARCLEPGCGWESRRYDRIQQAQAAAKKHGETHFGKKQGVAEGKITLSTDPNWYGAEVGDYTASGPVVNIPANRLVGFEPDDKMNQPKSKANVEKIVAGLKQGAKLPPLLVRKYKNGYQVLDGHHRFWAYKLLGVKSIPAQIVPDSDIEEKSRQGVAEGVENNDTAISLSRLGRFHKGQDTLAEFVPERVTARYALHPEKWESTFYSLTNKDPRKLKYYGPKEITIPPGTLVGDMALANRFYRAKTPEEKQHYADLYRQSLRPYPVDVDQYRMPELLIPKQGVAEGLDQLDDQLDELVNKQLFRQGFEDTRSYGEYTLVAKPGYMPYIPGKNSVVSNFFRIEAYKGRVMVGWVNFEDKDGDLEALDLQVDQKHRRKGIATAMYDFAKDLGNTIKPSTKQTAMGKKFWAGAKDRVR